LQRSARHAATLIRLSVLCCAVVVLRVYLIAFAGSLSLRQLDDSLSLLEADGETDTATNRQTADGDFGHRDSM